MVQYALRGDSIIDVGLDWLTLTCATEKHAEEARPHVVRITDNERLKGNDIQPWRMAGFEGLLCGQIQWGRRGEELMIRLTGGLAKEEAYTFHEVATNVSRLDIQVTACCAADAIGVVVECARRAQRFKAKHNHRRELRLQRSDEPSATFYIGKRTNDTLGRLYTKGLMRDSGYPADAIRAEVEIHKKPAWRVYQHLCSTSRRRMSEMQCVGTWFSRVGLPIEDLPETFDLYKGFARHSDDDSRLEWLKTQVRGAVRILKDSGKLQAVIDALGLSDDVLVVQSDEKEHWPHGPTEV